MEALEFHFTVGNSLRLHFRVSDDATIPGPAATSYPPIGIMSRQYSAVSGTAGIMEWNADKNTEEEE